MKKLFTILCVSAVLAFSAYAAENVLPKQGQDAQNDKQTMNKPAQNQGRDMGVGQGGPVMMGEEKVSPQVRAELDKFKQNMDELRDKRKALFEALSPEAKKAMKQRIERRRGMEGEEGGKEGIGGQGGMMQGGRDAPNGQGVPTGQGGPGNKNAK